MKDKLKVLLNRETVTYGIFGLLTTVLSISTYAFFLKLYESRMTSEAALALSNTLSTMLAILFAFVTNKIWVFRSASFKPSVVAKEFVKFITGRLFTYLLETAALIILVSKLGLHSGYSKIFTTLFCQVLMNYVISKKAVFKKQLDETKRHM